MRTDQSIRAAAQTKNESAVQVADLIGEQMASMASTPAAPAELTAKKSNLVGGYGRALATTNGLANILGNLALYGVPLDEITRYTSKVEAVTDAQVQAASAKEVTYYPEPPAPPVIAPPGAAPSPESFWVPGNWVWNGERYVFVTDFLGAGSMGEMQPDGGYRPPRPEESVKIEADQLVPRDGQYALKIAEPMDEVTYLDRVQLILVHRTRIVQQPSNQRALPIVDAAGRADPQQPALGSRPRHQK